MKPERLLSAPPYPDKDLLDLMNDITGLSTDEDEVRFHLLFMQSEMVKNFLRKGKNQNEALLYATHMVQQLNLARQAILPMGLTEQYQSPEMEPKVYITSRLARMALLTYPWDSVLPAITGTRDIQRRHHDETASCQNCIAACCISMYIPLKQDELKRLLSHGTILNAMVIDSVGFIRPQLHELIEDQLHRKKDKKIPAVAIKRRLELERSFTGNGRHQSDLRLTHGYCSELDRRTFGCKCHGKSEQPQACQKFPEGGSQCENRYTHRESIAAQYILKIVNDAEPILSAIAFQYGLDRPQGNFVPLTSF